MARDFLSDYEKVLHIKSELAKVPGVIMKSDMAMVHCPFHGGDNTPSCAIYWKNSSKNIGGFYCFGCGKAGSWNTLANALGLEPFYTEPKDRYSAPLITNTKKKEKTEGLVLSPMPLDNTWRGLPTSLLARVGCKIGQIHYSDGRWSKRFVYMPVIIDGKTEGYIKARLQKEDGKPSYVNKKGNWVKSCGLFPFDYAISQMTDRKTIVLVEGQRDALRLLRYGVPALCIMGTHNWNEKKCQLLEMHGVKRVIIAMDGDDAGIEGTRLLYPLAKEYFESAKVSRLWKWKGSPYLKFAHLPEPSKAAKEAGVELWDYYNCPMSVVEALRNAV